jgi:lysozyme
VTAEPSPATSTASSTVPGIDVSHYQGQISWTEVAHSGIVFAYIKATQGLTGVDSQLQANWSGAKDAGLLRGAYHFYQPDDDPEQQADHFLNTVPLGEGDLPPGLDVEISNGQSTSKIIQGIGVWLAKVKASTGQTPVLYTDPSFWATLGTGADQFGSYPLWIAEYGNLTAPKLPAGWKSWTFWQHSETGQVTGISTTVDLDVFQGTVEELRGLVKA